MEGIKTKMYTVTEYEQCDFDKIKSDMTIKRAVEVLESLPRGWFPYRMPCWNGKVTSSDLQNYEVCCAIDKAIEHLKVCEVNEQTAVD